MQPQLALNFWSSCLNILSAGTTRKGHHTSYVVLEIQPRAFCTLEKHSLNRAYLLNSLPSPNNAMDGHIILVNFHWVRDAWLSLISSHFKPEHVCLKVPSKALVSGWAAKLCDSEEGDWPNRPRLYKCCVLESSQKVGQFQQRDLLLFSRY